MNSRSSSGHMGVVLRWVLLAAAAFIGATLASTLLILRCAPDTPTGDAPAPASYLTADSANPVKAEMRTVDYYVDPDIPLHVHSLRGELQGTRAGQSPVFDDRTSFAIHIASAVIVVDTTSLSLLMNRYVFGYRGAPIHDLHLSVEGKELIQRGKLGNVSFTIRAEVSLASTGEIRLHPTDVKVLGINADGLMSKLGIELDEMVKVQPGRGIRIVDNDFLLDVSRVVPPPRILGKLTRVALVPSGMLQVFGDGDSLPARTPFGDSVPARNYMFYHGGTIRFGKLTMTGTDLFIADADPSDPLGFYLARYHDQLVAGSHRTTPEDGLVVAMPDYADLAH